MQTNAYDYQPVDDDDAQSLFPQLHLWDYLQVVLQRMPLASAIFLTVILLTVLYTWTRTPRYTATARILAERSQVNLTNLQDAYDPLSQGIDHRAFMQTQVNLITSQPVLEEVLSRSGLLEQESFKQVKDPLRLLSQCIRVTPERNTSLIAISVERRNRDEAAAIANLVVDAFQNDSRKRKLGVSEDGLTQLYTKKESLREKLDGATKALQDFMVENNMVSLERTQNVIVDRLRDISHNLTEAQPRRMAFQAKVQSAEDALQAGQSVDSLPEVLASTLVTNLKIELAKLERNYSELLDRLGANHPKILSLTAEMDSVRAKIGLESHTILQSLKTAYQTTLQEERLLQDALKKQEEAMFRYNKLAAEYDLLLQNRDSIDRTYRTIMQRIEEIDINRIGGQGNNIFSIERARVPTSPSWPRKTKNIILGLILGVVLAATACFFLDYMDTTVKSETDVTHILRAKVLGAIPNAASETEDLKHNELIVETNPRSFTAEAFRSLRTALAFSLPGGNLRTIVVTSTFPEEGKSLLSMNICAASAQAHRKTLLIDADMRKPRLHNAFAVSPKKGLSNLLSGASVTDLDSYIIPTSIQDLYFLPCGPIPPHPVELLDSERFQQLLAKLTPKFDFVVIDSPPGLSLADSLVAAKRADGLVLVVRSFVTQKNAAKEFVERLRSSRVRLLGVVLNNVDIPRGMQYYDYYRFGRYGKYYYYYAASEDADKIPKTRIGRLLAAFSMPRNAMTASAKSNRR